MLRVEIWIATTLFSVGIIAGMTYLNMVDDAPTPVITQSSDRPSLGDGITGLLDEWEGAVPLIDSHDSALEDRNNDRERSAISKGDDYFLVGNFAKALDYYDQHEKTSGVEETKILLREAMCFERQQDYVIAQKKFYRSITTATNQNHHLLAVSGFARCLLRDGKRIEALEILSRQTLKLDLYLGLPEEIRAQLVFQYAKALESLAVNQNPDLTSLHSVTFEEFLPRLDRFIAVINQPSSALTRHPATPNRFSITVIQRPTDSLNMIMASTSATLEPVLVSLGQIAIAAELELMISQNARSTLENRSRTIELHSSPLSSVLDKLLVGFDLSWYQVGTELHVMTRNEFATNQPSKQHWFETSLRAFRRFELLFPDDDRRPVALLSRANLNFIQNKIDIAANYYQELIQSQPKEETLAKMFFNLAKLKTLLDRTEEANRYFYLAIDQTMDPNVESSSYCLLGSNHLSAGDLENAIRTSRRGLMAAVTSQQKQLASLVLARSYLLSQKPYSANNSLFRNQTFYESPQARSAAAILGAYARFIGTKETRGIETARNRLLSALVMTPNESYTSFADCYLASHAFEKLGFRDKAIEKLFLALAQPDVGVWRRQINFELGVLQKRSQQYENAIATFGTLTQLDDSWSTLAFEQIARIYFETDQNELCIETCKQWWQSQLSEQQKRTALQILGSAFQKQGENHSAALCFAGMLPDSF